MQHSFPDIAALPSLTLHNGAVWHWQDGRTQRISAGQAQHLLQRQPHLLCHAAMLQARLRQMVQAQGQGRPVPARQDHGPAQAPGLFASSSAGQGASAAASTTTSAKPASPQPLRHHDVAELFAFVLPAVSSPPLVSSFAAELDLSLPDDDPAALHELAAALLHHLQAADVPHPQQALALARMLERSGWPWAQPVLAVLEKRQQQAAGQQGRQQQESASATGPAASSANAASTTAASQPAMFDINALAAWDLLAEWEDNPPAPPPGQEPVTAAEAQRELARILGPRAEERADQRRYAAAVAQAFVPRPSRHENTVLLAEAGTGLGKTLGYLAPAALWARRNAGSVWVATYTRNLQRQLLDETRRLWPEPALHRRRVSVRKGRENYLCLLNAEETLGQLAGSGAEGMLLAALLARWMAASRDGDMVGGDFPAWLLPLLGGERLAQATPMSLGLTDRRGECTYAACRHFRKCFIEKARVRAERADIVIANHAVVLTQAAYNVQLGQTLPHRLLDTPPPARLVFDEGHHLFDAADSAFSGHLSLREAVELRRWIRGAEGARRRGRGLRERLGDLLQSASGGLALLQEVEEAARTLPLDGWRARLQGGAPAGAAEAFFLLVRNQVLARADMRHASPHALQDLETDCLPLIDGLPQAAEELMEELAALQGGMRKLAGLLLGRLEQEAATLNSTDRNRLEAMARGLVRRGELLVGGWRLMLGHVLHAHAAATSRQAGGGAPETAADAPADAGMDAAADSPQAPKTAREAAQQEAPAATSRQHEAAAQRPPGARLVKWFSLTRMQGQEIDIGLHAHWVDPTIPLAECVLRPADSVVITSATLRDSATDAVEDGGWQGAEMRTGAVHLPWVARRVQFPSPFDHASQARVFVINDLDRDDIAQAAAAFRALFLAAGGGALGLFTAISRLKQVHQRLLTPLEQAGLPLYAQHVDALDTGTLVDIFRAQRNACLLGTDALRDGIDVPGASLRLVVMERVPWQRPTILERARQQAFGRQRWSDMQVRLRLRQAFGRLIRKADDHGVFVMLDNRLSSRFFSAFPDGTPIRRCGLAEAVEATRAFLRECRQP